MTDKQKQEIEWFLTMIHYLESRMSSLAVELCKLKRTGDGAELMCAEDVLKENVEPILKGLLKEKENG